MEIPIFVLVAIWFAVACIGVLVGVAVMAVPSMISSLRRSRQLAVADVQSHHAPPTRLHGRRVSREALIFEGETVFLSD